MLSNLLWRILNRLRRELLSLFAWGRNCIFPTFIDVQSRVIASRFSFLDQAFLSRLESSFPGFDHVLFKQAEQALAHRFDLLGSGLVHVEHGMVCNGLNGVVYEMSTPVVSDVRGGWLQGRINRANIVQARRIWSCIDQGYRPIDWQLDFKSGYRWREDTWHQRIRFAHLKGVDIKVPWELARLQHLPTLALAAHSANPEEHGFRRAEVYVAEFRNQVLDFIATNPPGFGVNWSCAMDVAIRAANMLVARDIVLASGASLDTEFEAAFFASVLAHGRHILNNLEWSPRFRGNHYLANIVGLLFVAVYLPCTPETDDWLAFAVHELIAEVDYQFHEDGSNFEASVCYHRLSSEMVLWAFALLVGLPAEKQKVLAFERRVSVRGRSTQQLACREMINVPGTDLVSPLPEWCWVRLARMAEFTRAMTRPDHLVAQIGDNDSGRFITLASGEQLRCANDPLALGWSLDHKALVAAIESLCGYHSAFPDPYAEIVSAFAQVDSQRSLMKEYRLSDVSRIGDEMLWADINQRMENATAENRWRCEYPASCPGLIDGVELSAFTGMGCYVMRSPRLYLVVRCGEIGLAGLGAHAHCDQLAIELAIDGVDHARDPGTMIYTALPELRNAYRSVKAHHAPRVGGREPANLQLGPFDLRGAAQGECLYFGPLGFIGRHKGYGEWIYRIVVLDNARIVIHDFTESTLQLCDPTPTALPFSSGYGLPAL